MGDKKLRMILAGAGFMGREHIDCTRTSANLMYVGIVDPKAEAAKSLADAYQLPHFTDLAVAIRELSPDAVDICTPTPSHLPLIRLCAQANVAVLCEKPIAHTLMDARAIRDLAHTHRLSIMVAQVIRFWPEYAFVRQMAATRHFGDILAIDCKRLCAPPAWNSWMLNRELSGGAAVDMQVHDVDFVQQLLGRPAAVSAQGRVAHGAMNTIHTQLHYANNIPVRLETSMLMPTSFSFRMYFSITFERAVAEMDFWRAKGQRLKIFPNDAEAFAPSVETINAYQAEIEYFAQCVLAKKPFDASPLEQAIDALEVCLASEHASQTRTTVTMR